MKRILALIVLCTLLSASLTSCSTARAVQLDAPRITVTPADSQKVNDALARFGLALLQDTRGQAQSSTLVSPLSVALALSMAANGSTGDTLTQFETVLGGGNSVKELNASCAKLMSDYHNLGGSTQCSIANSLWCDPQGQIREDFVGKCQGVFDAQIFQAELSAPSIIKQLNGWVSEHTKGMIPSVIDQPVQEATAALLVNALYLKNTWAQKFSPNDTWERDFTQADGQTRSMDFLSKGSASFPYIQGEGVQGVVLPYDDGRLAFAALLPEGELDDWLDRLDGEALSELVLSAQDTLFLNLALPKFEAQWSGSLTDLLAGLGLDAAFDLTRADFSLLGDHPQGYYLSQVIHATKIQVNEEGTKAAAATVVAATAGSAPPQDGVTLVLDRPFLYGIFDLENGVPLFLGTLE